MEVHTRARIGSNGSERVLFFPSDLGQYDLPKACGLELVLLTITHLPLRSLIVLLGGAAIEAGTSMSKAGVWDSG